MSDRKDSSKLESGEISIVNRDVWSEDLPARAAGCRLGKTQIRKRIYGSHVCRKP